MRTLFTLAPNYLHTPGSSAVVMHMKPAQGHAQAYHSANSFASLRKNLTWRMIQFFSPDALRRERRNYSEIRARENKPRWRNKDRGADSFATSTSQEHTAGQLSPKRTVTKCPLCHRDQRYVQKCTQQQKWQKWQNFANNNLEGNANEKTRGPPCKAGDFGEFGESGKNGKLVKIADNNLEANANEKTRGPPCKAGEFGESSKNGKLVKIADNNLEANANEKTRGPPCKAGDFGKFGESGKNGKLVKIADNLEANANEKTRGPPCKAGEFGETGKNGKLVKIADNNLEANANEKTRGPP